MIKILFFIETLGGGGAEKVLCNLVNNMDPGQFDITVQTVWKCDASEHLKPYIHYKYLFSKQNSITDLLYRFEAETGIAYRYHIVDDYDIECAYLECGSTKVISKSTNQRALKLAWIHCDLMKAMRFPKSFAKKTKPYYTHFDKAICVSQLGKQSFDALFGNTLASDVIQNTIDRDEILRLSGDDTGETALSVPLVVSVGRLARPKNYIRLLTAHKRALEEGLDHQLWILGEGPDRKMLEDYIAGNQLQNSAFLRGFVQNPYPYMRMAYMLACSSIYECFSTFVTEGLILGKPIVTTNVSGMPELLGDSEYGMITDNSDQSFFEGYLTMLKNPSVCRDYAEKAFSRGKDFDARKLSEKTQEYLVTELRKKRTEKWE